MPTENGVSQAAIPLQRFAPLYLIPDTPKGRGVFAASSIASGTIIDTCPVLILDPEENIDHVENTSLYHYTYNWPVIDRSNSKIVGKTQAVVFGLGSMFNHSREHQNVGWTRDLVGDVVVYRALRDIERDEELCISYGDHLTFIDADAPSKDQLDEVVAREAKEILSSIAL